MVIIKTFANWKGDLSKYLTVGDLVDEQIVEHFINVLPPATFNEQMIQIGEPYSHVNGKAVHSTLKKTDKGWMYLGHCFIGQTETIIP